LAAGFRARLTPKDLTDLARISHRWYGRRPYLVA
jgi:hypothetical protein